MSTSMPDHLAANVSTDRRAQLGAVLNRLARDIPGVAHVCWVSADGLRLAHTADLDDDHADQLAAMVSGRVSLDQGAARLFDGGDVHFSMTMMAKAALVIVGVSGGSSVAALAEPDCDLSAVSAGLTRVADQIGDHLAPAPMSNTVGRP